MEQEIIEIYTDGATVGVNGKLGTVKEVCLGVHIPRIDYENGKKVRGISNNEAEFKALIWGMQLAIDNGFKDCTFLMDSKIVRNRAIGMRPKKEKFKNARMDSFQDIVMNLSKRFDKIRFKLIPREMNTVADYHSNIAKGKKCEG